MISETPKPPYYAVIFTSILKVDSIEYNEMADLMVNEAKKQKGFLGIESARESIGISVSYWTDLESIKIWKENTLHKIAQEKGKKIWYGKYITRIAKVERDYVFDSE